MAAAEYLYTPIVKGKMWDLKALGRLSVDTRALIKPMIEAMPLPKDGDIDAHLQKFTHYLVKYYPNGRVFVDFYGLMPGALTAEGTPAVLAGFKLLKQKGRVVTPAYGFSRDDELWAGFKEVVSIFNRGFCFRIDVDDLDDVAEETWAQIIQRTGDLGLQPNQIDLIVDLRDIRERDSAELKDLVIDFLSLKPMGNNYRSIALVGSCALKTVSAIPKDGEVDIVRNELRLWTQLQIDLGTSQQIVFGDYGIVHPDFSDVGASKNKNAKIRYTHGPSTRYFRGHRLADPPGFKQFHELAERVRNSAIYRGRSFSFGDCYVDDCADFNQTSGHLGTWIMNDMNHHVEYVAVQMARLTVEIQQVSNPEDAEDLLLVE